MVTVILALGSNIGDRLAHLKSAVAALTASLNPLRASSVYESPALMPEGAPESWDIPFLNMAVSGETALSPQALLKEIKAIEQRLGRVSRGVWGPREIDIDILAYGDEIVAEAELTIPHRELLKRDFALIPLAELAPGWVHPLAKQSARDLAAALPSQVTKMKETVAS